MKKILVTGADGQLGRAIQKVYENIPEYELICTARDSDILLKLDISDENQVKKIVSNYLPDIIINCAAFTAVDLCEDCEDYAFQVNAIGPQNLAKAAKEYDAILVQISTDYVFDGMSAEPLKENHLTNPISAYGRTKLAGEKLTLAEWNKVFILRTAWLYGDGKNFVTTMLRLAETRDVVRVVSDQWGSPTYAMDLARAIYELIPTESFGIYHISAEGFCTWAKFAETIFEYAGVSTQVEPISTEEYQKMVPQSAKRPFYSVLDHAKIHALGIKLPTWQQALKEYFR